MEVVLTPHSAGQVGRRCVSLNSKLARLQTKRNDVINKINAASEKPRRRTHSSFLNLIEIKVFKTIQTNKEKIVAVVTLINMKKMFSQKIAHGVLYCVILNSAEQSCHDN